MRKVDNAPEGKNKRKAERYEQVIGADQQPVENLLEDKTSCT
jgi:hypothetical protein